MRLPRTFGVLAMTDTSRLALVIAGLMSFTISTNFGLLSPGNILEGEEDELPTVGLLDHPRVQKHGLLSDDREFVRDFKAVK